MVAEAKKVRPLINVVSGGESCGYGVLNVKENLWLFAQIYGVSTADAKKRIDKMLDIVGLADKGNTKVSHLSTGQRQKMNFCRGFITDPKILFLDEPTLGLDVNAARSIRVFVRDWLKENPLRTLLLTTHYMAEADELCDRLAVIDKGKVLACDTPANLKARVQEFTVFELRLVPGPDPCDFSTMNGVKSATATMGESAMDVKLALEDESVIGHVIGQAMQAGCRIQTLKKVEPSLEDVFIAMVGHGLNSDTETNP